MAVSLKAEEIFEIGHFQVTNSLLTVVLIAVLFILFFIYYTPKITVKPRSKFQLLLESVVHGLHDLALGIMGKKLTNLFFPLIFTFFTLIIFSNWFGLMPFVGSIGYTHPTADGEAALPILVLGNNEEQETSKKDIILEDKHATTAEKSAVRVTKAESIHTPLFRSPSADLNFTIAMALLSFILIEYAALKALGVGHLQKFFDYRVKLPKTLKQAILTPFVFAINLLWKTLELILELARIISFSFRLFGNIFAGEVLLFVITTLTFGLLTLPFIGLEIFVGFIQATVFVFLTMVFIKVGSEAHH
jgi:F-type H+-transporting ATPase subunit a